MRRLASNTVLVGFIAAWFLAASPTRRSEAVKATYDGVVRLPWSLAMISTRCGGRGSGGAAGREERKTLECGRSWVSRIFQNTGATRR